MIIEVIPSRTPNNRFDGFKVVYGGKLDLNGHAVPVILECFVETDSLLKLRTKLDQCVSESVVSEHYPKGVADTYCTEIKKIGFSFKCLPVADLQVLLPLIWGSFKTTLETSELHYHIPGCELTKRNGRAIYTSRRDTAIEYDVGHDLFDVLDCVLKNFTKGTIVKNTWTFESDEFGTILIADGRSPYTGKISFDTVDIASDLYSIYKGKY